MTVKKTISFLLVSIFVLCASKYSYAQNDSPYVKVNYVIVQSTKNYLAARETAAKAAEKLGYELNLRDLSYNTRTGLSLPKDDCEMEGGFPCYIARGRYDSGAYVSVEWSNAIYKFAKGFYVVIVASGDASITQPALEKAKRFYRSAYSKSAEVYVGCMH